MGDAAISVTYCIEAGYGDSGPDHEAIHRVICTEKGIAADDLLATPSIGHGLHCCPILMRDL